MGLISTAAYSACAATMTALHARSPVRGGSAGQHLLAGPASHMPRQVSTCQCLIHLGAQEVPQLTEENFPSLGSTAGQPKSPGGPKSPSGTPQGNGFAAAAAKAPEEPQVSCCTVCQPCGHCLAQCAAVVVHVHSCLRARVRRLSAAACEPHASRCIFSAPCQAVLLKHTAAAAAAAQ